MSLFVDGLIFGTPPFSIFFSPLGQGIIDYYIKGGAGLARARDGCIHFGRKGFAGAPHFQGSFLFGSICR